MNKNLVIDVPAGLSSSASSGGTAGSPPFGAVGSGSTNANAAALFSSPRNQASPRHSRLVSMQAARSVQDLAPGMPHCFIGFYGARVLH